MEVLRRHGRLLAVAVQRQPRVGARKVRAGVRAAAGGIVAACAAACASWATHPPHSPSLYGLHPRVKRQVGERLARAALTQVYGGGGARSGPTISGCAVHGRRLSLKFNASLLNGEKLHLRGKRGALSPLQVLVNASQFCRQPLMRCPARRGRLQCRRAGVVVPRRPRLRRRRLRRPERLAHHELAICQLAAAAVAIRRGARGRRSVQAARAGACLTSWVSLDIARLRRRRPPRSTSRPSAARRRCGAVRLGRPRPRPEAGLLRRRRPVRADHAAV